MRDKKLRTFEILGVLALIASFIAISGCQPGAPAPGDSISETVPPAAEVITADTLRAHVARLAGDEMAGRAPGTEGARLARQYLADTMAGLGLEPAFAGEWEQLYDLVSITSEVPKTWRFTGSAEDLELSYWDDYIAGSGIQSAVSEIEAADLVFVGYGIQAPEFDWDDFKGAELNGKILLMLNNDPEWDENLFAGDRRLYYGRWDYKYESAARQGATGAIIIHTTPSAGYPWQVVQASWTGPQFELPAGDEPRVEIAAWITDEAAQRIAARAGENLDELIAAARSRDFRPVDLGIGTSLTLANTLETVAGGNVGGILEGSDPQLKHEVVVYSAHHDHFGIGEPNEEGDAIYNGALDNASGSAAVLTIAEAFAGLSQAPARSLLFLFVDGEEQGLLGSEYYALHPTFEPGRIAANINIDGANIWGKTSDVGYIGYGKSSLDAVVEEAAGRQGRSVKGDQFPDRGHFYRSDQFNFAKIGVPAIYLANGVDFIGRPPEWGKEQVEAWEAIHYHQPSDQLEESWNFDGFVDDTLLNFHSGRIIAESPELPAWNPGDEFEAARLEALAALE